MTSPVAPGNPPVLAGRYCLISPVRNEADYMRRTLDSVIAQTVPPDLWVIVDDGSTDETPAILADYAARVPFIRIVTRADRGHRAVGGGVIEAFKAGLATVGDVRHEFLCKLDMDLILPPAYFETLMAEMGADPRLGSVSGKAYYPGPTNADARFDSELISEAIADDVSVGASKFYRRACFDAIGGLVQSVMWDGVDCYKARMHGWRVRSIDRPELRFIHLRPMGSSDRGILIGRQRHGRGHWYMGSSPVFVLATALYRLRFAPVVTGSLAMLWGYAKAGLTRQPRIVDPAFRRYLRRYQWAMMRHGKAEAMRRFESEAGQ